MPSQTPHHLPAGKLVPLPIPRRPWSHVGVDFVTDLPKSEGYTCILVAVARFSKACKLIPLRGLPTALETAEALFHNLFRTSASRKMSSPTVSHSLSPCLEGFLLKLLCHRQPLLRVSPPDHGQTERKIQEIGRYLRAYWNRFLPWAEYAQKFPKANPFQCILGYPSVSLDRGALRPTPAGSAETQDLCRCPPVFHPIYRPGDKVWLSTWDLRLRLPCRKLSPPAISVPLPSRGRLMRSHSVSNSLHGIISIQYSMSSLLKPVSPSVTESDEPAVPPPPEIIEEPLVCRVQEILDSGDGVVDWNILLTGREDPGRPGTMCWIPLFWPSFTRTTLTLPHPEAMAGPITVIGRQEEGTVRESPQSPQSPLTTLTISQSPDF